MLYGYEHLGKLDEALMAEVERELAIFAPALQGLDGNQVAHLTAHFNEWAGRSSPRALALHFRYLAAQGEEGSPLCALMAVKGESDVPIGVKIAELINRYPNRLGELLLAVRMVLVGAAGGSRR
jgi:hypothetical protein